MKKVLRIFWIVFLSIFIDISFLLAQEMDFFFFYQQAPQGLTQRSGKDMAVLEELSSQYHHHHQWR